MSFSNANASILKEGGLLLARSSNVVLNISQLVRRYKMDKRMMEV